MSKGGSSSSQQSESGPLPWLEDPYLKDMVDAVWNVAPKDYYPNWGFIPMNQLEMDANRMGLGYAMGYMPNMVDPAMMTWGSHLNAADVANNPYVNNMLQKQADQLTETLREDWLPEIRSNAVMAGQSGSSRHGIAESKALEAAQEALIQGAVDTQMGAYQQGLGAEQQAYQQLTPMMQSGMLPMSLIEQIGMAQRENEMQLLNDDIARWNFYQQEPYDRLGWQASIFNSVPTYSKGSQSSESSQGMGGLLSGIGSIAKVFAL